MSLLNFIESFLDEATCKARFKEYGDQVGVICFKCGSKAHYRKSGIESYKCKSCGYRQSLKANMVMYKLKLPFRYWFMAMHLLTSNPKEFFGQKYRDEFCYKFNRRHLGEVLFNRLLVSCES
jgi:DNA-directed RNA polymerase subunit RPC12/RpoP